MPLDSSKSRNGSHVPPAGLLRRVYAVVDRKTFSNFAERASAEGVELAKAFESLVRGYAFGDLDLPQSRSREKKAKPHHSSTGADYLKEAGDA